MDDDAIIQRWKTNAAATGILLTDEDVSRILGAGFVERILRSERIIEETGANNVGPDYLGVLSVYAGDDRNG